MSNHDDNKEGFIKIFEQLGNKLPDPTLLFICGTLLVFVLSALASSLGWQVTPITPSLNNAGQVEWTEAQESLHATSLINADGLFWFLSNLDNHFAAFPPLRVVLVGMLGIGLAERCGLIAALLNSLMRFIPKSALTPAVLFAGIMSSTTLDAGYVVLPPLAAALYMKAGRSPLTGIVVVFAGVSAGFNANLFITGLDPMLAKFTEQGAQVMQADYQVNPACNWFFMIASTFIITAVGWWVTQRFVEPAINKSDYGPRPDESDLLESAITPKTKKALRAAGATFILFTVLTTLAISLPQGALHGKGLHFDRWVEAIVPLLFLGFLLPGLIYGKVAGTIKNSTDFMRMLSETMASMAPIIVLAFFAAQFIEAIKYSGLDKMVAMAGGKALAQADIGSGPLVAAFIVAVMFFNLFIGSMSAKYAMLAPIFVPMLMVAGISPELTQAAYRIGDSVTNTITPLNPYMIIMLAMFQRYAPRAGLGTLISTMLPYTIAFFIVWTLMLLLWIASGFPLGPDGFLSFQF